MQPCVICIYKKGCAYVVHVPTQSSVAGKLLVNLLHALYVDAAGLGVVHHRPRVVDSHDALGCLLHFLRGIPRIIDVFGWKASQHGQITPGSRERRRVRRMNDLWSMI